MGTTNHPDQPKPKPPEQKVPWFVMEEADNIVKLVGGLFIFLVAMIGLFIMEALKGTPTTSVFLKEGIIHAIFGYITGWISASKGNKSGGGKPYVP